MNAAVTKRTQETLGKVIRKPPLTEKLLSKPPFRYLHDILSEVIRTTGFMKGLYGEAEMKSDNVKDKDSKIAFLQKAIDVVMLVSGESVAAKPARIVAGHEPEKTNELLQTIAKCCINKLSSDEAVRRVLSGDKVDLKGKASSSRSQGKENREEKREIKESSISTEQNDPDQLKDVDSRRIEKERHRDRERTGNVQEKARTKDKDLDKDKSHDRDKDRTRDKERGREKEKDRDKDKVQSRDREREKNRERHKERERTNEREQEKDKTKERDLLKDRERVRDKDREQGKRMERETEKERLRKQEHQRKPQEQLKETTDKKIRSAEKTNEQKSLLDEPSKNHRTEPAEQESPARIPRPSSAKGQRRRPKPGALDESDSDMVGDTPSLDSHIHLENGHASDVTASFASQSNRRIARPSSARPAPPRVKRQESYNTDTGTMDRLGSAKHSTAVIVDGKKLSEDEDEDGQFVVEEAAPPADMLELQIQEPLGEDDATHGGLVKKILETKKDYESSASAFNTQKQDRTPVLEAARKKERELVAKEIERMRTSIQSVCRSALPLGKIMDYIQEDMDAMQNELQSWRCENKVHAQALLEEQRITDEAVQPLKAQLTELEQLIRNEQEKICAIKSNILGNEEKIQKMLSSITISSRS